MTGPPSGAGGPGPEHAGPEHAGPEPERTEAMHWAIPRGLIVLLVAAATVVAITGAKAFSGVLGPVFLALMFAIAAQPIQTRIQRRGRPAWVGMIAALAVVYLVLLGLVAAMALSAAQLATALPDYSDQFSSLFDQVRSLLEQLHVDQDRIEQALSGFDFGNLVEVLESALRELAGVFSNLLFVLALLLFMAFDGMTIGRRMNVVAGIRPDISHALSTFAAGTRKYLIVSTVFGLIVAVLDGAALWVMAVPFPILWGLLSFITNYIPNIGFVIGLIPPALLALLDGGWTKMVWVIVLYCVFNVVVQSVIQPKFVGDAVGLSVTVTFLSLVFWSWVLGALGALLAIPLTLLAKALLFDIDPSTRWMDVLISDRAPPTEPDDEADTAEPAS
ncbi:AI-2E family transporter [Nocardia jinanensis]|uniref:AI-2E family transporter n=3 Tax=Nocardia jinanensis TaxID=382504 RepID=A0A917RQT5_9NOCA|nr:AI-2E family transporter [Nocardia jinanensis]GGL19934.1 AI-2E family transporter [Nocardia jinanensis]